MMKNIFLGNFVEISFAIGLLLNAVLFIPQIIQLIKYKNSEELSLITFGGFWLIQLSTVLHGLIRRDFLLTFGNFLSLCTCGTVVWLIIYYRMKDKKMRGNTLDSKHD